MKPPFPYLYPHAPTLHHHPKRRRANRRGNLTQWLAEHRSNIIGMSDNVGCGCCIDSYYIVAESNTPVPPSGASGTFEARKVLYGAQRDEVLDMLLDF